MIFKGHFTRKSLEIGIIEHPVTLIMKHFKAFFYLKQKNKTKQKTKQNKTRDKIKNKEKRKKETFILLLNLNSLKSEYCEDFKSGSRLINWISYTNVF